MGAGSSLWFNCVARGDVHSIWIGARSNIQDGSIVHVTGGRFGTVVGDDVLVGHLCIIHGCRPENESFAGMGSTVMDGCVIEHGKGCAGSAACHPARISKGWPGSDVQRGMFAILRRRSWLPIVGQSLTMRVWLKSIEFGRSPRIWRSGSVASKQRRASASASPKRCCHFYVNPTVKLSPLARSLTRLRACLRRFTNHLSLRNQPTLAAELIRDALHVEVPASQKRESFPPISPDMQPAEYRADMVIQLFDRAPSGSCRRCSCLWDVRKNGLAGLRGEFRRGFSARYAYWL